MTSVNAKLTSHVDNNGIRSVTRLRWDKADIVSYYVQSTNQPTKWYVLKHWYRIDSDYDMKLAHSSEHGLKLLQVVCYEVILAWKSLLS